MAAPDPSRLESHYTRGELDDRVAAAIEALTDEDGRLDPARLGAFDEFHIGGRAKTERLIDRSGIASHHHVLDVGCGLGGPARTLARLTGCRVTGIDLSAAFCRVGAKLNGLAGCADRVSLVHGSALELPFKNDSFDAAWIQHMTMNIPNERMDDLLRGVSRVLKPGGVLAMHEILAGANAIEHFPVPWASNIAQSHLTLSEQFHAHLDEAGFVIESWDDLTEDAIEWFSALMERIAAPPSINLTTVMGDAFPTMAKNLLRNLREDRARVVMVVGRRTE